MTKAPITINHDVLGDIVWYPNKRTRKQINMREGMREGMRDLLFDSFKETALKMGHLLLAIFGNMELHPTTDVNVIDISVKGAGAIVWIPGHDLQAIIAVFREKGRDDMIDPFLMDEVVETLNVCADTVAMVARSVDFADMLADAAEADQLIHLSEHPEGPDLLDADQR